MQLLVNIILIVNVFVCVALIALVLLQRSEGGALGMGGGSPSERCSSTMATSATHTNTFTTRMARMVTWTSSICSRVGVRPVPMAQTGS